MRNTSRRHAFKNVSLDNTFSYFVTTAYKIMTACYATSLIFIDNILIFQPLTPSSFNY